MSGAVKVKSGDGHLHSVDELYYVPVKAACRSGGVCNDLYTCKRYALAWDPP